MARGITMLAEPPIAASSRIADSVARSGASAHPIEATVNSPVPAISGPRRPNRSDSVPCVICPIASPRNQVASVTCAVPGRPPSAASIAGNAGRYMSVEIGPTAASSPSSAGSHEGNILRFMPQCGIDGQHRLGMAAIHRSGARLATDGHAALTDRSAPAIDPAQPC